LVVGDGPVLADDVVRTARLADDSAVTTGGDADDLVVAVPVDRASGTDMTVRAATSRWDVYTYLTVVGLCMTALGVCAPAAAWLLARRLAGRLSQPLEQMSAAARRLGNGDFAARAPASGIPEIDAVSDSLAETAARIDRVLARERTFSADASHQLRTPLASLRLGLETAVDTPGADLHAALTAAIEATDRLHATIEDLLALARDTHRTGELLDLDRLPLDAAEAWRGPLATQGRTLTVQRQPDAPATTASVGAVRQILGVLLDNAHTHGDGAVRVIARQAAGVLALDVRDEGHGVPDTRTLFQRRAPGSSGHGIGLALARNLAEAEGGRLRLSTPQPTTFTLLLPPISHESPAGSIHQADGQPSAPPDTNRRRRRAER
jgi:signal transduction histidine kinase